MNIAIIGSREFKNSKVFLQQIEKYRLEFEFTKIISGGARGADSLGEWYAMKNKIPIEIILPNWDKHGKAAGMIRNMEIIKNSDIIIAFYNGISPGTNHSIEQSKKLLKKIIIYNYITNTEERYNF